VTLHHACANDVGLLCFYLCSRLTQGLPHIHAMITPSREDYDDIPATSMGDEPPESVTTSEESTLHPEVISVRSTARTSDAIELCRSLSESKRLQQRNEQSLRDDVRKFYAEIGAKRCFSL
jgi:hypothetical protein